MSGGLAAVVLAAGLGTRMQSKRAKVLHEINGRPLLQRVLGPVSELGPEPLIAVIGHQEEEVRRAASGFGVVFANQVRQRGTGDAVAAAIPLLDQFRGNVLIVYGDMPLLRAKTLVGLTELHRQSQATLSLVTAILDAPLGYGRIIRGEQGALRAIVEQRDLAVEQEAITEVNAGIYCAKVEFLRAAIAALKPDNAQNEYYLTDIVGQAIKWGEPVATSPVQDRLEIEGVNSREELAVMERHLWNSITRNWMARGVTIRDPATVYIEDDVVIGRETEIGPNTHLKGSTRIGERCRIDGSARVQDTEIGDHVHLRFGVVISESRIADRAVVGPFAHLRPGTELGPGVHIGNFVETKKASVGAGSKANHLTYLGDTTVGEDTNIGAGTITCNYDGFEKHKTVIGSRVQIGSDTQLVAPVEVEDDAYIGAGTTVTRRVSAGALVTSRVQQKEIPEWVSRRRERARKEREAGRGTKD